MNKKNVPTLPLMANVDLLNGETIISLYKTMLLIRFCEQRIAMRVKEKKIITPCHLYLGQEACAVGVCSCLKKSDYVFSNHRSHGHYLAKCGDIDGLMSEVYCKENGCSGGHGGSMHLCNPEYGLLGSSSIVGGVMGIGIGPALKSKIMGLDNVSVIFHGDCVPEEGIWHESLNFSAINKLPVVYICENNLYAASSSLETRRLFDNIEKLATEHGLNSVSIDGNDVFLVRHTVSKAVELARKGFGPQFIELRTYRWLGHVGPNDDINFGLRDINELNYWKERCPILAIEKYMINNSILDVNGIERIHTEIMNLVDNAETKALKAEKPRSNTLMNCVYYEDLK